MGLSKPFISLCVFYPKILKFLNISKFFLGSIKFDWIFLKFVESGKKWFGIECQYLTCLWTLCEFLGYFVWSQRTQYAVLWGNDICWLQHNTGTTLTDSSSASVNHDTIGGNVGKAGAQYQGHCSKSRAEKTGLTFWIVYIFYLYYLIAKYKDCLRCIINRNSYV